MARRLTVAYTTALRAIRKLESIGFLSLVTDGRRDRVWCANAMLEVLGDV